MSLVVLTVGILVGCSREATIVPIPQEPGAPDAMPVAPPPPDTSTTDTDGGLQPQPKPPEPPEPVVIDCGASSYPQILGQCGSSQAVVGGQGFATLQGAIETAPGGSLVYVCPGQYGPMQMEGRDLELIAADPSPGATVISGNGNQPALMVDSSRLVLQGIEIRDGFSTYAGGGIQARDTELTLRCVTVADNTAEYEGGGLHAGGGPLIIEDSLFQGNHALYEGGALEVDDAWSPMTATIRRTRFVDNTADYSGGALAIGSWADDVVIIEECEFTNNQSFYEGGAISAGSWGRVELDIRGSTFADNHADYEGGAVLFSTDLDVDVAISDTSFVRSTSGRAATLGVTSRVDGGGSVTLTDVSILESTASYSGSAALEVEGGTRLVCNNCDLGTGATDNSPSDVNVSGTIVNDGAGTSFNLP